MDTKKSYKPICKEFEKYQFCKNGDQCIQFHKKVCSNWQQTGMCTYLDKCYFLHKDCKSFQKHQECKYDDCKFYHRKIEGLENIINLQQIFYKQCQICYKSKQLIYHSCCGAQIQCLKCYKQNQICNQCSQEIQSYIV